MISYLYMDAICVHDIGAWRHYHTVEFEHLGSQGGATVKPWNRACENDIHRVSID
jgi:hypothetical protein